MESNFSIDVPMLTSLGFTEYEMRMLAYVVSQSGKCTVNDLINKYGVIYEQAKRIKYLYDICTEKVVIESEDDLVRHLRKMFGAHKRIGVQDLQLGITKEIPRTAMISGIPENLPFAIWNSEKYHKFSRLYTVLGVSSTNIIVETDRIPILKYGESKVIDGMLEIRSTPKNGMIEVAINQKYCRLCNRFVIVASFSLPERHLGMYQIICIEGTKLYVFADIVSGKSYNRYGSSRRVYDYGLNSFEIEPKLTNWASQLSKKLYGVNVRYIPANMDFETFVRKEEIKQEERLDVE